MNSRALACLDLLLGLPGDQRELVLATVLGCLDEEALSAVLALARRPMAGLPEEDHTGLAASTLAADHVSPTLDRFQALRSLLACEGTLPVVMDDALFQDLYLDAGMGLPPKVTLSVRMGGTPDTSDLHLAPRSEPCRM